MFAVWRTGIHGEAWRQRPLGGRKNLVPQKYTRSHLTPAGLLMEGDCTSVRFSFAFLRVNECNDVRISKRTLRAGQARVLVTDHGGSDATIRLELNSRFPYRPLVYLVSSGERQRKCWINSSDNVLVPEFGWG